MAGPVDASTTRELDDAVHGGGRTAQVYIDMYIYIYIYIYIYMYMYMYMYIYIRI